MTLMAKEQRTLFCTFLLTFQVSTLRTLLLHPPPTPTVMPLLRNRALDVQQSPLSIRLLKLFENKSGNQSYQFIPRSFYCQFTRISALRIVYEHSIITFFKYSQKFRKWLQTVKVPLFEFQLKKRAPTKGAVRGQWTKFQKGGHSSDLYLYLYISILRKKTTQRERYKEQGSPLLWCPLTQCSTRPLLLDSIVKFSFRNEKKIDIEKNLGQHAGLSDSEAVEKMGDRRVERVASHLITPGRKFSTPFRFYYTRIHAHINICV